MKTLIVLMNVKEFCINCNAQPFKCDVPIMCCYKNGPSKVNISTLEFREYLMEECPYWMEMMMKYLVEEENE